MIDTNTLMHELCSLEEKAYKDIKKLNDKSDITPDEWKVAGAAVDIVKDIATIKAMNAEYGEDESYSYRGMNYGDENPMHYGRKFGTYRTGSASYRNGMNPAVEKIRNLMNTASSEGERMMYQRFLDENEGYMR